MLHPFRSGVPATVLIAGAIVSGCSGGGDTEPVDAQVATYSPMTMAGAMQTLKGTLIVDEGCVYIDDGETRWLPVFPEGLASWEKTALVMDGQEYAAGEEVAVEGGKTAGPAMQGEQVPEGCETTNRWIVSDPA
ncbi:hypothetical protein [Arthrobacter monumenti]